MGNGLIQQKVKKVNRFMKEDLMVNYQFATTKQQARAARAKFCFEKNGMGIFIKD